MIVNDLHRGIRNEDWYCTCCNHGNSIISWNSLALEGIFMEIRFSDL